VHQELTQGGVLTDPWNSSSVVAHQNDSASSSLQKTLAFVVVQSAYTRECFVYNKEASVYYLQKLTLQPDPSPLNVMNMVKF
jgi:hypothetical protein